MTSKHLYLISFAIVLISLAFILTRCSGLEYGPQPPTRIMEIHNEAVNGVVMPEPSPIDWDHDPDYQ